MLESSDVCKSTLQVVRQWFSNYDVFKLWCIPQLPGEFVKNADFPVSPSEILIAWIWGLAQESAFFNKLPGDLDAGGPVAHLGNMLYIWGLEARASKSQKNTWVFACRIIQTTWVVAY